MSLVPNKVVLFPFLENWFLVFLWSLCVVVGIF